MPKTSPPMAGPAGPPTTALMYVCERHDITYIYFQVLKVILLEMSTIHQDTSFVDDDDRTTLAKHDALMY